MKKTSTQSVHLAKFLLDKHIAVSPALIKLTGSYSGAILLSQIIYWETTMGREFWKTNEEWQKELFMSEQVLETAKKKIAKYITIEKKGMPAKNHYTVNWEKLIEDAEKMAKEEASSHPRNYPHQSPQKLPPLVTPETTPTYNTEITTEITTSISATPKGDGEGGKPKEEWDVGEWIEKLSVHPNKTQRLVAYYFKAIDLEFPTKEVANEELRKNLPYAKYLSTNFTNEQIIKTVKYCQEHYSDVLWNLATVKKQISHVIAKSK